jgi:hypothetical protein
MHAFRDHGKTAPRILYWFRTPPSVRVGRAALDEEAIRSIEESHPGLEFDWTRMLKAAPAPETPAAPPRQRERDRRRPAPRSSAGQAPRPSAPPAPQPSAGPKPAPPAEPAAVAIEAPAPPPVEPAPEEWTGYEDAREAEAFELIDEPGPPRPPAAQHVEERVGHEGLGRLRARYAELMARIAQRITDPARLEELRTQAERLNPDTWVTDEEARHGIETFDAACETLRAGLGRRRRRRRGGARRRARFGAPDANSRPPGDGGAAGPGEGDPAV